MNLHSHDDGISIPEVVGPYAWGVIHHAMESFPCEPCAEHGVKLVRFIHDMVNAKTGKPIKYVANYRAVLREGQG